MSDERRWVRAVLGLGSNLGSREAMLRAAADVIATCDGVREARVSQVRETAPMGPAQPPYLNAAVGFETWWSANSLMDMALSTERLLERVRDVRWGPRTIDVDVLWIDGVTCATYAVTVPHPGLRERAFALAPLVELVPDARDPTDGARYADVLAGLADDTLGAPSPLAMRCEGVEVEHTADECFEVRARSRADLLAGAAEMIAGLVIEPESVEIRQRVKIECARPEGVDAGDWGDDERMFAWLSEVLYAGDGGRFAVRRAAVIDDNDDRVRGVLLGEPIDEEKHSVRGAIKAVTYHQLEVTKGDDGRWFARVVVDV